MRAQSAVEFLSTYSLEFLVIAIVIAALAALAITAVPTTYAPSSCYISASFTCDQAVFMSNTPSSTFIMIFNNNLGTQISFSKNALNVSFSGVGVPNGAFYGQCSPSNAPQGSEIICNDSITGFRPSPGSQLNIKFYVAYEICSPTCAGSYQTSGSAVATAEPSSNSLVILTLLTSSQANSIYPITFISIDGTKYPNDTKIVLFNRQKYNLSTDLPNGYVFNHWSTTGGVSVVSTTQQSTSFSASTSGNLIENATPIIATIPVGPNPDDVGFSPSGGTVYIANYGTDTVSVINASTNTVVNTIIVGSQVSGVRMSNDGSRVFTSNYGSGTVSIINTATNGVIQTDDVGSNPFEVAVSPDDSYLYVVNKASASVSVISVATDKVVNTITVGSNPVDVELTSNGKYVYVPNYGSNTISVISTATDQVVATVPAGAGPYSVAFSPSGAYAYVPDYNSNTVSIINTSAYTLANTINVGGSIPAIAVATPDGRYVYVSNYGDNYISVISTSNNQVVETISVPGAWYLNINPVTGNLYDTNYHDSDVIEITTAPYN